MKPGGPKLLRNHGDEAGVGIVDWRLAGVLVEGVSGG